MEVIFLEIYRNNFRHHQIEVAYPLTDEIPTTNFVSVTAISFLRTSSALCPSGSVAIMKLFIGITFAATFGSRLPK